MMETEHSNNSSFKHSAFNSASLFKRSALVTPGGVHSPVRAFKGLHEKPLFFDRASGPYVYSVEGSRYIDFCMSFGPFILGHRDEEVEESVKEMISKLWSVGASEPYSLRLAEWVSSEISFVEALRFVSSGTEAVMSALRLARGFTGRNKIVKFDGCYHGHVDSMLVRAGSGLAGSGSSSRQSEGLSDSAISDTLVSSLDDEKGLEELFQNHGSEIAALIIEPLPANYGLLPQREEFIKKIFLLSKKYGSLVIFDEVISGFRVSLGGMADLWNVKPDLVCYGKVIGGGFPIGAFGGRADIMKFIAPEGGVYQAGTLSAHPVTMTAGLSTLKKLKRENVFEKIEKRAKKWTTNLENEIEKRGLDWRCVCMSSLFWWVSETKNPIRKVTDIPLEHEEQFKYLFSFLLKKNIYLSPSPYEVNFLSLAHTDEILQESASHILKAMEFIAEKR